MKAMKLADFECGDVLITDTGKVAQVDYGQSVSGVEALGEFHMFDVTAPDLEIQLAYAAWDNGEADVRAVSAQGNQALQRLERGGLRLGIYPFKGEKAWFELRQAKVKMDTKARWSNLFNASPYSLDEGARQDVRALLKKAGATKVGTKAELLDASNNTRNRLCAMFPAEKRMVPIPSPDSC